jgi:hypothetical protein
MPGITAVRNVPRPFAQLVPSRSQTWKLRDTGSRARLFDGTLRLRDKLRLAPSSTRFAMPHDCFNLGTTAASRLRAVDS